MSVSEGFETGHQDRVSVIDINFDGSRILTASVDHRIKVWNVDRATSERHLLESWTAHDADIRDAKWFHPSTGSHLATIGNDLKCHLWQEDTHQAPRSGRRFRKICTIPTKLRVPFVSLDIKNVDHVYTFLALIDRQGLLSVYEPNSPDDFKDWTLVDQFNVCTPPPGRGEQTCFKVRFDQNITPLPYVNCVSDNKRQLSLVVTAMNDVKIYRSVATSADAGDGVSTGAEGADGSVHDDGAGAVGVSVPSSRAGDEASRRFMLYEAVRLPTHPALVRDVAWAPFNVRGSDLFATACKDGAVRIFDMQVGEITDGSRGPGNNRQNQLTRSNSAITSTQSQSQHNITQSPSTRPSITSNTSGHTTATIARHQPPHQSYLTSAITSQQQQLQQQQQQSQQQVQTQAQAQDSNSDSTVPPNQQAQFRPIHPPLRIQSSNISKPTNPYHRNTFAFPYSHNILTQAILSNAHNDAWSVIWDPSAQILISGGDDGSTKIWRRGILDGYQRGRLSSDRGFAAGTAAGSDDNSEPGIVGMTDAHVTSGQWMLFADQAVEIGSSGGDGNGSDGADWDGSDDDSSFDD